MGSQNRKRSARRIRKMGGATLNLNPEMRSAAAAVSSRSHESKKQQFTSEHSFCVACINNNCTPPGCHLCKNDCPQKAQAKSAVAAAPPPLPTPQPTTPQVSSAVPLSELKSSVGKTAECNSINGSRVLYISKHTSLPNDEIQIEGNVNFKQTDEKNAVLVVKPARDQTGGGLFDGAVKWFKGKVDKRKEKKEIKKQAKVQVAQAKKDRKELAVNREWTQEPLQRAKVELGIGGRNGNVLINSGTTVEVFQVKGDATDEPCNSYTLMKNDGVDAVVKGLAKKNGDTCNAYAVKITTSPYYIITEGWMARFKNRKVKDLIADLKRDPASSKSLVVGAAVASEKNLYQRLLLTNPNITIGQLDPEFLAALLKRLSPALHPHTRTGLPETISIPFQIHA